MIHQLAPDKFHHAAGVLAGLAEWNVYLTAVLNQDSPGRLFVDDPEKPGTAFAVSLDSAYLAGNPHNAAFNQALTTILEATLLAGDRVNPADPELSVCLENQAWEQPLADILSHWRWPPIWGANQYYLFDSPKLAWREIVPQGYTIARLNGSLLASQGAALPQNIADSLRIGWQTRENFLANGFGFVVLKGGEIVCWCLADVTSGQACEIGIETAAAHRRRGLATAVTAATVEFCRESGFSHIGWHCGADNPGSIATAVNVGFVLERPYSLYSFHYDEATHFAELGRIYFFEAEMYAEAAEMLEIALERNEDLGDYVYLLAARASGHLGKAPEALRYLKQAINRGLNDRDLLQNLPEFAFLHGRADWQKLLERLP